MKYLNREKYEDILWTVMLDHSTHFKQFRTSIISHFIVIPKPEEYF